MTNEEDTFSTIPEQLQLTNCRLCEKLQYKGMLVDGVCFPCQYKADWRNACMTTNLVQVFTNGTEAHEICMCILREYTSSLTANGMEYQEKDSGTQPFSISITAMPPLPTLLAEIIKTIIERLCDRLSKESDRPTFGMRINTYTYLLPWDRTFVIDAIDSLTGY